MTTLAIASNTNYYSIFLPGTVRTPEPSFLTTQLSQRSKSQRKQLNRFLPLDLNAEGALLVEIFGAEILYC
jgi:hypothetical protein